MLGDGNTRECCVWQHRHAGIWEHLGGAGVRTDDFTGAGVRSVDLSRAMDTGGATRWWIWEWVPAHLLTAHLLCALRPLLLLHDRVNPLCLLSEGWSVVSRGSIDW